MYGPVYHVRMTLEVRTVGHTIPTLSHIPLRVIRSPRRAKSISIQVRPDGIQVRVPQKTPLADIDKLLVQRQEWILKHWEFLQQHAQVNRPPDPAKIKAMVRAKALARCEIPKRVSQWAAQMNLSFGDIRIKDQKTRWGSCSKSGNLNFNWRLILAPDWVLDYVIVHELCHLVELNHSARFWRLVQHAFPRYQEAKAWLRENGSSLFR
jgi:predicted metal-dependent hydrolase